MMGKYKKYFVTFDEKFFNSLESRWLTNIEIFLLLNNIEELIKNNFIKLSSSKEINDDSLCKNNSSKDIPNINNNLLDLNNKLLNYFFISYSEYGNISKKSFSHTRYYNIKIKSIDKIKVINSINEHEQRRIYFLLENPKYIFIHYRFIDPNDNNIDNHNHHNHNKLLLDKININPVQINIINFSPDSIEEGKENQKLFLIIKSKFTLNELNYLNPFLSVSFGDKFVKCEVISESVLSCYIPPQKKKEVIIDIYFSNQNNKLMNKISTYIQKNKKSFAYTSKNNVDKNKKDNNNENNISSSNIFNIINEQRNFCEIKTYKIFNYGIKEIILRVISLFNYFLSHINYYMDIDNSDIDIDNANQNKIDKKNITEINNNDNGNNNIINLNKITNEKLDNKVDIDISLISDNCKTKGGGFKENNVNLILEKVIIELQKINKIDLINYCDEDGYNLLHYLSALNFSKSLILLNENKLNFTEKSKDNLTVYEICAGKRNLDSLLTIIEIMEKKDSEKERNWYDLDVYKSALILFLEKQASDYDDIQILNALLKQIKIKYMIDSLSGKIIDYLHVSTSNIINDGEEVFMKFNIYKNSNATKIQRVVKSWLKRNKYKSLQKYADWLIEKIKKSCKDKKFSEYKNPIIFVQHEFRKWVKEIRKNKNK